MSTTKTVVGKEGMLTGDEKIAGTDYTVDEILRQIGTVEGKRLEHGQLLGYEVKDLTGGQAFLSNILQLRFVWKSEEGKDKPNSIILKVPTTQNFATIFKDSMNMDLSEAVLHAEHASWDMEGNSQFIFAVTKKEAQFYQLFNALSTMAPANIPPLKIPKFYFTHDYDPSNQRGLIAMEDMAPVAVPLGLLPGLSGAQMEAVVEELAKLHSLAWIFKEKCAKGIDELPPDPQFIEALKGMAMQLIEIKPEWFADLVQRLLPHYELEKFVEIAQLQLEKYGFQPCMVHGDLWSPNLLWRRASTNMKEASAELASIIDWQMVHLGNPMEDLARVISLGVPADFRRENTPKLLELYLANVEKFTAGGEYGQPKNIDQVMKAYRQACLFIALGSCFGVVMYYTMPSVVGEKDSPNREANQMELLARAKSFLEDALNDSGL